MRNPSTSLITAVVSALFFLLAGFAEAVSLSEKEPAGAETGANQFDPHDLSGRSLRLLVLKVRFPRKDFLLYCLTTGQTLRVRPPGGGRAGPGGIYGN